MKFGYARVSTRDQNLSLQTDALLAAGCERIYNEQVSGAGKKRPELERLLEQLREGDVVVVWKLDRLGRSLIDLVHLVNTINERGAGLQVLQDNIDTTTAQGKLVFHIFSAMAEFEREVIRERTRAGLAAARARGRKGGRPKGLSTEARIKASAAASMYQKLLSVKEITKALSISPGTLYKYLRHEGISPGVEKPDAPQ